MENLKYFKQNIPNLLEVSIGHALVSDALYLGMENTVAMYKDCWEISYWLLVIGYWLLVIGYWFIGYWLLVIVKLN